MYKFDYQKRSAIPDVSGEDFRRALRQFASGVTVVTAEFEGVRYGITVSAFASITLEPPTIMVALGNNSRMVPMVLGSEHFAVHILAQDQEDLAQRFATPAIDDDKFDGLEADPGASGAPNIRNTLALLDCVLDRSLIVGTHTVMFGRVVHIAVSDEPGSPLLYYHRSYRKLAE